MPRDGPLIPTDVCGPIVVILCEACVANENRYRAERGRDTGAPENWPQQKWTDLTLYEPTAEFEAWQKGKK